MSFFSGMLESWSLRDNYVTWLKKLEVDSDKASKNGMKECNRCGWCCARRPCMPTPNEIKQISDYLGLEVKEMVKKYFVADRLGGYSTKFIFPAKETQLDITGTFIDWERTYDKGYCVFYDKESRVCKVHEVRPYNAKITNCWEDFNKELHEEETAKRMSLWDEVKLEDFGIKNNEYDEDFDDDW